MPRTQLGRSAAEPAGELLVERALPARERLGRHAVALGEGVDQLLLVELVGREGEREPVAVPEPARRLVPEPRELTDVGGDLGADRLRRLPCVTALGGVVALAKDPLDLGVSDLDPAHDAAVARETQVDRRLELDDSRAERRPGPDA